MYTVCTSTGHLYVLYVFFGRSSSLPVFNQLVCFSPLSFVGSLCILYFNAPTSYMICKYYFILHPLVDFALCCLVPLLYRIFLV